MNRRAFVTGLGAVLAAPLAAEAQREGKTPKLGVLYMNTPVTPTGLADAFWERLRELGWVDRQNIAILLRGAAGNDERLRTFAAELVSLKADVIVRENGAAAKRVDELTSPIPICVVGADLQAAGTVKNLARPEGHVTGVQVFQPELVGKRVTMLKQTLSGLIRVGMVLSGPGAPTNVAAIRVAEDVCRTLRLKLHVEDVPIAKDLEHTFSALTRARVQGLLVMNNPSLTIRRDQVIALATKYRLPAIYEYRNWSAKGGLMSYGAVATEAWGQLAECVDKILRGAKPADVPVQQPTKFELVINLKTAKALGLTIPPSLLLRADQVIE